jgi:1,2-phenylacetyl-CoA epoxidase catalytic subunit
VSTRIYSLPIEQTQWHVPSGATTVFNWEYDDTRDRLLTLYEKGKEKQWNTNTRLDWSTEVDPRSGANAPDYYIPIFGSDMWEQMDDKARGELRHHMAAWMNSQFLHGEQGALICAAKIVQTVPDLDAKFYAATQVMDEARHMETYSRYLREKIEMAYPINAHLKSLLNDVVNDSRWDMTNLGMQVLIEGLALAAFSMIRDYSTEPLAKALNTYVMQDEARHVAFGRLALREFYPQLTEAERAEREEFVVYACYLMRDRFLAEEVWDSMGLDRRECIQFVEGSEMMQAFRKMLFSRIVPTIKDLGLWGPKVRKAYEDMDVMAFQDLDPDELSATDEQLAREMDQRHRIHADEETGTAALSGVEAAPGEGVKRMIQSGADGGEVSDEPAPPAE